MINEDYKKAIFEISELLIQNSIKYAITGSTNLALQGIPIIPQDIDIVVEYEDLQKMVKIFPKYLKTGMRKMETKHGEAWEVLLDMDGVEVQFFAEMQGEYHSALYENSHSIEMDDRLIYCLPLRQEMKIYEDMGKKDKAKMIENWLRRKRGK
ncbi:MAG: hypothetical protein NTY68_01490 [Candidatus Micrarchaeota archaeon]|nr:hypothetical protein [Candidatus Micrarchaeota archaeon]